MRCALLPTHAEELAWLADFIAHLVRTGTPPVRSRSCAVRRVTSRRSREPLLVGMCPVEVVGLSGLLRLPEVADLVAVCEVLQDPGANAALVRLLTGPRWRIGPRDLARCWATTPARWSPTAGRTVRRTIRIYGSPRPSRAPTPPR
ncbi:hypothetical protein SANTM175S_05725 [Streptomyces antimycoticus]